MIHKYLGVGSVIDAYWTLHLELVFYFICASLFYFQLLNDRFSIYLILFFLMITIIFSFIRYQYAIKIPIVMPLGLAVMFYGSLIRSWLIGNNHKLKSTVVAVTLLFFIALFIAQKMYYLDSWVKWYLTYIVAFGLFFLLISICKLHGSVYVYLGRISYSLYLLHPVVISLLLFFWWEEEFSLVSLISFCTLALVFSIIAASFSYHFIEKPSLVFGRKFKF